MTRYAYYQRIYNQGHAAINCPLRRGIHEQPTLLMEVGLTECGELCGFLWCRACHAAHPIALSSMFARFREMAARDTAIASQVRRAYIQALTEALAAMPGLSTSALTRKVLSSTFYRLRRESGAMIKIPQTSV